MPSSPSTLSARAIAAWEANAAVWDAEITRYGNRYWTRLQEPSLSRLLSPHLAHKPGCRALDLATGNGLCARWMRAKGAASVLATDASVEMLQRARGYAESDTSGGEGGVEGVVEGEGLVGGIKFERVDVTNEEDMAGLAARAGEEGRFDVVLMNMALMDVPDIDVLARALPKLLAEGGVFVATLLHPLFFSPGASRVVDIRDDPTTGEYVVTRGKLVYAYMSVPPAFDRAVRNPKEKQYYFHRPIHELFSTFFKTGMVMDACEELAFTEADADPRIESAVNFTQLPAILAFRMRIL